MKKVLLFSAFVFLFTPKAFAEVTEGKSSVNTTVTTNVNNSGNTSDNTSATKTHIEIEVNGEKKVLDTDEPGTHTVTIEKGGGKSSATVNISNKNSSSSIIDGSDKTKDASGEGDLDDAATISKKATEENQTIIQKIIKEIEKFFKNLFKF